MALGSENHMLRLGKDLITKRHLAYLRPLGFFCATSCDPDTVSVSDDTLTRPPDDSIISRMCSDNLLLRAPCHDNRLCT
jgi:hypothetical protein